MQQNYVTMRRNQTIEKYSQLGTGWALRSTFPYFWRRKTFQVGLCLRGNSQQNRLCLSWTAHTHIHTHTQHTYTTHIHKDKRSPTKRHAQSQQQIPQTIPSNTSPSNRQTLSRLADLCALATETHHPLNAYKRFIRIDETKGTQTPNPLHTYKRMQSFIFVCMFARVVNRDGHDLNVHTITKSQRGDRGARYTLICDFDHNVAGFANTRTIF